jgi:uncharacterized protein (DUF488 family)
MVLYTIGHSTHPIEIFTSLLLRHEVRLLIDVRAFPASRRWPQFNRDELKAALERTEIFYRWCQRLGGRRRLLPHESPHRAWHHAAFRSYADYADGAQFAGALARLSELAATQTSVIMCAEGLWWRCHRRIIADHMTARGWEVRHIMPDGDLATHSLPRFARIDGQRIIYDGTAE